MDRFKLYPRIYEVIWEIDRYRLGYSPNEKSVVQRYLYLKAGWSIAMEHPLFGVGNGDVLQAFKKHYEEVASPLVESQRRVAHNQYLTFLVGLGWTGLLISILALVGPLFLAKRQHSFLAVGYLLLLLIAMLSDDTLDSATGATLTGFFYSLFLFGPNFPWLASKSHEKNG
jgi:O-antigen ligase